MARQGVLGDVMSGFLRYDTADDFGRKKLIWVFLVAFLQLVLPICAIFCLFQLWLMARTGIPDHLFGVLAEKIRSSRRRRPRKKRDDDPWDGWRD